jgi:hypothetical protein
VKHNIWERKRKSKLASTVSSREGAGSRELRFPETQNYDRSCVKRVTL